MKLDAHIKLWFTTPHGRNVIGSGRCLLLKAIEEEGSLAAAAAHLGISYRKAWGDLKKTERHIGKKLLKKSRGGSGGGKTVLTADGVKLLKAYIKLAEDVEEYTRAASSRLLKDL